ncbi:hypothetical protein ALNOE001_09710 [Candidatus Methanobinarius endosymbioticus]|uniref:DUF357 domain-containing protein n=1 Tax=Candidatus Methanobinarius endosymbioticus TaxID=2006182 RepID=A0A366MD44_9EURY|nr:hypothetical protein ALNOE001_09710 [Candidatus Methanobinarius endosymbioticus]
MDYKQRIIVDIEKIDKSLDEINHLTFTSEEKEIIERAKSYKKDSKYYLEKKDEMTSFGCITYAHGLIDAIKLSHNIN